MGGLQADAAEPEGSRPARDPSLSDDEEAPLPQMILEFNSSRFGKKGPGCVCGEMLQSWHVSPSKCDL